MLATSASLLDRLYDRSDGGAWQRLVDLYTPLIRGWLHRHGVTGSDADDLVQEVFSVVIKRFSDFQHNQRTGAFRTWLRTITFNCVRDFWKANRIRPTAPGGTDFGNYLEQLADPANVLSQQWDREHDVYITRRLLDQLKAQFESTTWQAFQRVAIDGVAAADAAQELGMTTNAVFIAKSRVLARLREEAAGLIDS